MKMMNGIWSCEIFQSFDSIKKEHERQLKEMNELAKQIAEGKEQIRERFESYMGRKEWIDKLVIVGLATIPLELLVRIISLFFR